MAPTRPLSLSSYYPIRFLISINENELPMKLILLL